MKSKLMILLTISGCMVLTAPSFGALTHYVPFDAGYTTGGDLNGMGGSDLGFGSNTWFDGGPAGPASSSVGMGNLNAPAGLPVAGNHGVTAVNDFNLAFYTMDRDNDGMNGEVEDRLEPGEHWLSFVARSNTEAFFGGLSLARIIHEFFEPDTTMSEWALKRSLGFFQMSGARKAP